MTLGKVDEPASSVGGSSLGGHDITSNTRLSRTHWEHAINHSLEGEQRVGQERPMRSFNESKRILTVRCDAVMIPVSPGAPGAPSGPVPPFSPFGPGGPSPVCSFKNNKPDGPFRIGLQTSDSTESKLATQAVSAETTTSYDGTTCTLNVEARETSSLKPVRFLPVALLREESLSSSCTRYPSDCREWAWPLLSSTSRPCGPLSYLDEDLQPLQPVAVVLEEILQFPDVLQQVGFGGRLAQGRLEEPRALRHPGHVLHQHLLPLRRHLGTRDWGGREKEKEKWNVWDVQLLEGMHPSHSQHTPVSQSQGRKGNKKKDENEKGVEKKRETFSAKANPDLTTAVDPRTNERM
ncbi:hypothetical protein EYF80_026747 [Liparis tanakae]|uniref:Uncharacterized protein n=1 Tax=Liparis tanakae TaxID=230148 RepID=A0A4Z2HB24_9TELE|nr:hypothetical protein EYF80_026747 [Liparis tanakae]